MAGDQELRRWSLVLTVLAAVTLAWTALEPLTLFWDDGPIALARGTEIWSTSLRALPGLDRAVVLIVTLLPQVAWVFGVAQVFRLARRYASGRVFDLANTGCFVRLGASLVAMGLMQPAIVPVLARWLNARGIAPWVPDASLLQLFEPDLIMAGAFFFVLGKIMRRGTELQESDRLTI
jgi:hypothetical protein